MGCASPDELKSFTFERLDPTSRQRVSTHLEDCASCRAALQRVQAAHFPSAISGSVSPADVTIDSGNTVRIPTTPASARLPRIEGYQITGVLGQGGMGIVYKAVQTKLNRMVALKVLPAMVGSANPAAVQRFRREATAAARLHHTNIVPIYDFGESTDAYYYAMEYIVGQPLDEVVGQVAGKFESPPTAAQLAQAISQLDLPIPMRRDASVDGASGGVTAASPASGMRGRAYFRQVARWVADTADALHYAHSQDIIHRDIKPANLILSVDGRIMVADFGLAKSAGEGSVTVTGALVGTLRYMSPEQAMAKRLRVDHRTDIYSLGATLYELLCFKPAYPGMDDKEILSSILTRDPPPPRKHNAAVPAELDTICMKCMEKSADARYDTARALAEDLRRYVNDLPIVARPPGPITRALKFARRNKLPVMAVTAILIIATTAILWRREIAARQREEVAKRVAQIASLNDSAQTLVGVSKQWVRGEADLRAALELDPNHAGTLLTLAWLKLEHYKAMPDAAGENSLEDAIAACEKVLSQNPDDIKALGYLGLAQRRLERYPEAVKTLERALQLDPSAFATWSNLGALYVVIKDIEKGQEHLLKGAKLAEVSQDRWRAATWRNLATLELFRRDPATVQHVANALACDSVDVQSWLVRARYQMEMEGHINIREALDDAKHADRIANFKNPRAKRVRALAHLANRESGDAIEQSRLAMELQDEPSINLLIMAAAAAEVGQLDEARQHLAGAERAWPPMIREAGTYRASAGTGDLWIDSADERLTLAAVIKAKLPAVP